MSYPLELVTAIIKPYKLDNVKDALLANGIEGLTIAEVRGFGRQRGKSANFRGLEYQIGFVPKIKIEIIVPTELLDTVIGIIETAATTGKIGDGKVWATSLIQ